MHQGKGLLWEMKHGSTQILHSEDSNALIKRLLIEMTDGLIIGTARERFINKTYA